MVSKRTLGTLPRNSKVNSREHVNSISVRLDKEISKEENVAVVPKKSYNKKVMKISAPLEPKEVEPSKEERTRN